MKSGMRAVVIVGISFILTPLAIFLAVMSGGAGHGNYLWCKVLFPYTMLSTHFFTSIITPFIILALIQVPIYGILLAIASLRGKLELVGRIIAVVHLVAVSLCFVIPMPNFS